MSASGLGARSACWFDWGFEAVRLSNAPLRGTMLLEHPANPALGRGHLNANMIDAGPVTLGA